MLSIAASLLAAHDDTHVTLLYGNRRTDTVMFTEEIADLKNAYGPRLHLLHVLSREPTEAEIFNGRLDADRLRTLLGALVDVDDVDDWWLCGPLGMTDDALAVLSEFGVDRRRVHRELFYVDEPPPELHRPDDARVDGEGSEVTVVLDGRTTRLTLPRDVPVLDAAQKVRGDLPVRLQGRRVRDVPGQGHRGRRHDAPQLRPGGRRGRGRVRPHLPDAAGLRRGDRRLRRLRNGTAAVARRIRRSSSFTHANRRAVLRGSSGRTPGRTGCRPRRGATRPRRGWG